MTTETLLLSLGILSSSFFGSWHCAAMCSPLASLMAKRKSIMPYHLGRGLSYTLLGSLGGGIGSYFMNSHFFYLRIISGLLFGSTLLWLGWKYWFENTKIPVFGFLEYKWVKGFFSSQKSAWSLGFFSVFLPCGWLFNYFLASVATQSAKAGALVMFLFWLGGLPALSAVPLLIKKEFEGFGKKENRIGGIVLVGAGMYSLAVLFLG